MQIDAATILITGGSSGLGAACTEMLARRGARVIIADLAPPSGGVPAEIADSVLFTRTDVTSEADMRAAIVAGEERFGPLRGAVACAGVLHAERVLGRAGVASLEEFRRVIDINLNGTFNMVRLAAEAISRSEPQEDDLRGVLVMTSSVSAFDGQIGQAAYSASKGGVASLTLPLAREFGQHGIRVVSVAPGVFDDADDAGGARQSASITDRADPVSEAIRSSGGICVVCVSHLREQHAQWLCAAVGRCGSDGAEVAGFTLPRCVLTDRRWPAFFAGTFRHGAANRRGRNVPRRRTIDRCE